MNLTYYVDIEASVDEELSPGQLDDLLVYLQDYGGAVSGGRGRQVGISIAVHAQDPPGALAEAIAVLQTSTVTGLGAIEHAEVSTETAKLAQIAEPTIPELVGYTEIGQIAGVSRQRARELAQQPGFPVAVVTTASGPLRVRAAVEAWAKTRRRAPGRPAVRSSAGEGKAS